jgi:ERF superfamily protein
MADQVKNIHQRIAAITGEVEAVKKTGRNSEQKYDFIEYDSVTAALRKLMFTHGITVLQNMRENGRKETEISSKYGQKGINLVTDYEFTVTNVDDPKDNLVFFWQGEASDYGDKATNKAATAAEKYFLLKLFKIGTKDDPDRESPERGSVSDQSEGGNAAKTDATEVPAPLKNITPPVELAANFQQANIKASAKKIHPEMNDEELLGWLEELLTKPLDKLPKAWVAKAQEKLTLMELESQK